MLWLGVVGGGGERKTNGLMSEVALSEKEKQGVKKGVKQGVKETRGLYYTSRFQQ